MPTLPTQRNLPSDPLGRKDFAPSKPRRLSLRLALGSITEVDASALVVGHFKGVAPRSAELAVDQAIGSVINDFENRRMISGNLGEIFFIPTHRTRLYASTVILAGLGNFSSFTKDSLRLVGMNLIKGLVSTKIYDFGIVLMGSNAGNLSVEDATRTLIYGIYEGLQNYDPDGRIQEMTLAEINEEKYRKIREVLLNFLKSEFLTQKLDISFSECALTGIQAEPAKEKISPLNIVIRTEGTKLIFSALGESATLRKEQIISPKLIEGIRKKLEDSYGKPQAEEIQKAHGKLLFDQVVPEDIQKVILACKGRPIALSLDSYAASIPWELMYTDRPDCPGFLGLNFPIGRQLMIDAPVTKWLARRKIKGKLDFLLIGDPTADLPGAAEEARILSRFLSSLQGVQVTTQIGPKDNDAEEVLAMLGSGTYDIVHYAGHAYFDRRDPSESAWIFKDGGRVRARDLVNLSSLPALLFSNACEAGVVEPIYHTDKYGVAEALLRAGLINYIGTFWQINDSPGAFLAGKFYEKLLQERTIGESLVEARKSMIRKYGYKELNWGSYMLYGNPMFRFK
jgi:CHAT domain-containing protein